MTILAILVLILVAPAFGIAVWWRGRGEPDELPGLRYMRAVTPFGDLAAIALAITVLI
jgi:hypothetical protein